MAGKSYTNIIREAEVSLAVERILIGLNPTATWAPSQGRVDYTAPPAGFYDLGAVVEDTPQFKAIRSKFTLDLGIPAVRQYEAVNKLEGSFTAQLHSNSWRKLQFMLGNATAFGGAGLTSSSSQVTVGTIASVAGQYGTQVTVVQSNGGSAVQTVGMNIVFASSINAMDNPDVLETRITSVTFTNNSLITFSCYPVPVATPTLGWNVYTYAYVKQVFGTAQNDHYSILGVADFIDQTQVVHYIPNVVPAADVMEEPRPGQNERLGMTWNIFGYKQTLNAKDQLILAERYYFPPGF